MRKLNLLTATGFFIFLVATAMVASAAYYHGDKSESDPTYFLSVYPDKAGTKLDDCVLCHTNGTYNGTDLDSCQYCHAVTNYGKLPDQYAATLNAYGQDYNAAGRNEAAFDTIKEHDPDGDTYTNLDEITAIRYPGNAGDDPSKRTANYRIYSKAQLKAMVQHSQFMLMNTSKSGDYYVTYSGVIMQDLLQNAGIMANAKQITAISPDGYKITSQLEDSSSNMASFVYGAHTAATYYYDPVADKANGGWCDYSSPGAVGRKHGDPITVDGGLRFILALQADGKDLVPGYLDSTFKLASGTEGPFRTVTPQKFPGHPDQSSKNSDPTKIWPYDATLDHNAGNSAKCATIIKVALEGDLLPAGTTDIDTKEAGWDYIDQEKIMIYGALQGPTLVSPANRAQNVPTKQTVFTWTRTPDPDPSAAVTYKIEITTDPVNGPWEELTTKVASAGKTGWPLYAGTGTFLFFGICGAVAVGGSRRKWSYLAIFFMFAVTGAVLTSCGGDDHTAPAPSTTVSATSTQTLDPSTTYYWRVTEDGPNSHTVSDVSSFRTGQ